MDQFKTLLRLIEKHLRNPKTSKKDKQKLQKVKILLESNSETDWVKGFEIMGKLLTNAPSIARFFYSIWDWLSN